MTMKSILRILPMGVLDRIAVPIVLAPLAGGPSTPELAAAVCEAGGLGFLAAGYLKVGDLRARIAALRALTDRPFGVNLFVPGVAADASAYAGYAERVRMDAERAGLPVGSPVFEDDDWEAKLALVEELAPDVVSFTFGCPSRELLARLGETWVTVTTPSEASPALAAGADGLVVQGAEAGGHRGVFTDAPGVTQYGLLPLLQLIETERPLIATGGIATGAGVAAVLAAGAAAAQVGTAFLLAPEAGTTAAHRSALATTRETALTRAFTGRLARGIRNEFMDRHPDAPLAYPEIHHVTSPLRRAAREAGDGEQINLWAGEAHALAEEKPAAEIVAELAAGAREALARAAERTTGR
jgi:nitronate monooxygenase